MKGYVADIKKGKIEFVDDGLPLPQYPPYEEPEPRDLVTEIDQLKAEIKQIKTKMGMK